MLTIAIPTYNDYKTLDLQLERLSGQLKGLSIQLKLFDNNPFSDYDYNKFNIENLTYIKQHQNVGGDWNIFSCFINCETEFLWILSTNDIIKNDCIFKILEVLRSNKDIAFFHFGQQEDFRGTSLSDLLIHINYTDAFTISRCIYNLKYLKPFLKSYPTFINTLQAQYIIVILLFLHTNGLYFMKLTYDSIDNYRPSKWSKKLFIKGTFIAVMHLKIILKDNPKALKITLLKIQDMLMWQSIVARSYQNLNAFEFILFFIKICLISSKSKSLLFFKNNYKSFLNELIYKGYHKQKWKNNYKTDENPFKIEY